MDNKYVFKSKHGYAFYVGTDREENQVIVGYYENQLLKAVFFDKSGDFLRIEDWKYDRSEQITYTVMDNIIKDWLNDLGVQEQPIEFKKFFLPSLDIGVEDYPHERLLEENPQSFSEHEKQELLEEAESWKRRGDYVIWWGDRDYWVNAEGEITDS